MVTIDFQVILPVLGSFFNSVVIASVVVLLASVVNDVSVVIDTFSKLFTLPQVLYTPTVRPNLTPSVSPNLISQHNT